ncbi:CU044_2847 family protein [Microbacterium sp. NPDC056569]|uniref:CU044_2847 family protein n=1 Tax=Microbacterium sp. NPDC056569 TaxID=3345867 RepID=UPI003670C545
MADANDVLVEVVTLPVAGRPLSAVDRSWERLADARATIESAIEQGISLAVGAATTSSDSVDWQISEVSIGFGIKVTAEAGVLVSSVGGEASLEVTVRATRKN